MYLEKNIKKQERWERRWQYEKEKRSQLYSRYYAEARIKAAKEGIPSDPKGNLRAILKETYKVNVRYLDRAYPVSEILRLFISVITLGISILVICVLIAIFELSLAKVARMAMIAIALGTATVSYFVAPPIIEFFGARRKIKTAAECKAGYDLIEENEPLDD